MEISNNLKYFLKRPEIQELINNDLQELIYNIFFESYLNEFDTFVFFKILHQCGLDVAEDLEHHYKNHPGEFSNVLEHILARANIPASIYKSGPEFVDIKFLTAIDCKGMKDGVTNISVGFIYFSRSDSKIDIRYANIIKDQLDVRSFLGTKPFESGNKMIEDLYNEIGIDIREYKWE